MAADTPLLYYDRVEPGGGPRGRNERNSRTEQFQARLTTEEIHLLQECNRESFRYRCLPLGLAAMAATHLAVKRGYLSPHPKFGSALKQLGAAFVGWLVGKLSYRSICESKFLHLENSSIADAIRKKRGYILETHKDSSAVGDDLLPSGDDTYNLQYDADYHSSSGSLNLDTDKNIQYSGLDDRERPTVDSSDIKPNVQPAKPSVTYQELRRRNREAYEQQFQSQLSHSPPSNTPLPPASRSWDSYSPVGRQESYRNEDKKPPGNKYGDSWGS